jgi:phenylacetic acid degradation operon negative regulatory protein
MVDHRFGELRPDIWIRPANLDRPDPDPGWICTTGEIDGADPIGLIGRLWDLDALAKSAHEFLRRLSQVSGATDWSDEHSIPTVFVHSAAALRFLRSDPWLPASVAPGDWPLDQLRAAYEQFEQDTQQLLQSFLRSA